MITLAYDTTTLTLPEDLRWADEFDWHPVEQSIARTLTGALIVDVGARVAGRPITLQPDGDDSAWMPLATLNSLRAWAAVPGREMVLTINGAARDVMFRHQDGAIEVRPIVHFNSYEDTDWFLVTIKLMEI